MRRKISFVVLVIEVMVITILHIAKYKKEQPSDIVKSSYLKVETPKNVAPDNAVMVNMKY
jgi:hypothetical protein